MVLVKPLSKVRTHILSLLSHKMAAVPPAIVAMSKEEGNRGGERAQPAGPISFYHKFRTFPKACFLLSSPVYLDLNRLRSPWPKPGTVATPSCKES